VRRTNTGGKRSVRRPEPKWQRKAFDERLQYLVRVGESGISPWISGDAA